MNLLPDYICQAERIRTGTAICQHIPGADIDTAIGTFLVNTLTPLALESALAVADELAARADRLRAASVERARCHAEQARRRYLAVDPTNRLVAESLESDWNTTLRELADATDDYERAKSTAATEVSRFGPCSRGRLNWRPCSAITTLTGHSVPRCSRPSGRPVARVRPPSAAQSIQYRTVHRLQSTP